MGPVYKILSLVGAAALASTTAFAADFPAPPPQPQMVAPVESGGWYLRGDVGVGHQTFSTFDHTQTNSTFVWPASWRIDQSSIGDSAFVGFGAGYAWNNWFRFDVTGEYRTKARLNVLGSYTEFCPGGRCFDKYDGDHSSWVFLANAYIDLGTWWCITPFIGAGIGGAWTNSSGIADIGLISDGTTGFGYQSAEYSKWNLAWALHAGLTYTVSPNFKVELAYRYLNIGDVQTGIVDCASSGCSGTGGPRAFYTMTDFTSQDIKLGLRWMLQPEPVAPVYTPPPLMRRG
jgi:opacity protein-like surface antigen